MPIATVTLVVTDMSPLNSKCLADNMVYKAASINYDKEENIYFGSIL